MIKKILLAAAIASFSINAFSAENAGLVGFVNTNKVVDNKGFSNPQAIWTVYVSNDPSEEAVFLAYIAYKKLGAHTASIEWFDKKDQPLDRCVFGPEQVTTTPYVHTVSCNWGGRLPSGGITVRIFDTLNGKKEKISEMFLPEKS